MKRLFLESSVGQLHARTHDGGQGTPLLMLHAAPGSALMLAPLQERLTTPSLAIDLPGMGDSSALPAGNNEPTIAEFTKPIAECADQYFPAEYDVYGTLSGARVALELANKPNSRVRRIILDGIGIPKPEQLAELLEVYAPAFSPDINGSHLMGTFLLCRDQYLFYPWYARDAEHRRPTGLPTAGKLHTKTMESLKSAAAFRSLIRAAFRYDMVAALKALKQAALLSADGVEHLPHAATLEFPPVEPHTCPPPLLAQRAERINAFLAA